MADGRCLSAFPAVFSYLYMRGTRQPSRANFKYFIFRYRFDLFALEAFEIQVSWSRRPLKVSAVWEQNWNPNFTSVDSVWRGGLLGVDMASLSLKVTLCWHMDAAAKVLLEGSDKFDPEPSSPRPANLFTNFLSRQLSKLGMDLLNVVLANICDELSFGGSNRASGQASLCVEVKTYRSIILKRGADGNWIQALFPWTFALR